MGKVPEITESKNVNNFKNKYDNYTMKYMKENKKLKNVMKK